MERQIKFRGLDINGNWGYGGITSSCHTHDGKTYIVSSECKEGFEEDERLVFIEVNSESLGQYTGLKDKNGVEIYEGDVVLFFTHSGEKQEKVEWHEYGMWLPFRDDKYIQDEQGDWIDHDKGFEVIGNIHQP